MSAIEGDQKFMNKIFNIAKNFLGMIKTNLIIGSIAIVNWMIKILRIVFKTLVSWFRDWKLTIGNFQLPNLMTLKLSDNNFSFAFDC